MAATRRRVVPNARNTSSSIIVRRSLLNAIPSALLRCNRRCFGSATWILRQSLSIHSHCNGSSEQGGLNMTMPGMQSGYRRSEPVWDYLGLGIARRVVSLGVFGLLYSVLVLLGLLLRESSQQLTILWPAAGLLFMALWFTRPRNWVWIVGVQLTVELAMALARSNHFTLHQYAPFVLANSLDAIVGALVARRLMKTPEVPRVRHVLQFVAAVALGAAASAVLGAFGSAQLPGGGHYLREWQLWWAGNWLGSLCVAPVLMGWAVRFRKPEFAVAPPPAGELAVVGCALLATTIWVFSAPPGSVTTILDLPFVLLALVLVAAFRLPPRWCTAL